MYPVSFVSVGVVLCRMPAARKAKLEKVIKSIDKKKDVLTLECEWAACDFVCNDTDSFLVHISHHIDQLMMCESAVKSTEDAGKPSGGSCRFYTILCHKFCMLPNAIRKCMNVL